MITPFYASLLALLFLGLSFRTLLLRRNLRIGLGDGGNQQLLRAARVHANFAEYVPLSLFLIYMVEMQSVYAAFFVSPAGPFGLTYPPLEVSIHTPLLHGLGICLLLGRCLHAYGFGSAKEKLVFRVAGMVLTLTTIACSALYLLWAHVSHMAP